MCNLVAVKVNYGFAMVERNSARVLKILSETVATRRSVFSELIMDVVLI